jgi:hypothetical protein
MPDRTGSSAAETDMPKILIGSVYRSWAFISPATAPVGSRLASNVSTYALIWTTPRVKNAGKKFRLTSRTCERTFRSIVGSGFSRIGPPHNTRSTAGNCTAHCRALPATDPQARSTASRGSVA